jgi:hypothetical protein
LQKKNFDGVLKVD